MTLREELIEAGANAIAARYRPLDDDDSGYVGENLDWTPEAEACLDAFLNGIDNMLALRHIDPSPIQRREIFKLLARLKGESLDIPANE